MFVLAIIEFHVIKPIKFTARRRQPRVQSLGSLLFFLPFHSGVRANIIVTNHLPAASLLRPLLRRRTIAIHRDSSTDPGDPERFRGSLAPPLFSKISYPLIQTKRKKPNFFLSGKRMIADRTKRSLQFLCLGKKRNPRRGEGREERKSKGLRKSGRNDRKWQTIAWSRPMIRSCILHREEDAQLFSFYFFSPPPFFFFFSLPFFFFSRQRYFLISVLVRGIKAITHAMSRLHACTNTSGESRLVAGHEPSSIVPPLYERIPIKIYIYI